MRDKRIPAVDAEVTVPFVVPVDPDDEDRERGLEPAIEVSIVYAFPTPEHDPEGALDARKLACEAAAQHGAKLVDAPRPASTSTLDLWQSDDLHRLVQVRIWGPAESVVARAEQVIREREAADVAADSSLS